MVNVLFGYRGLADSLQRYWEQSSAGAEARPSRLRGIHLSHLEELGVTSGCHPAGAEGSSSLAEGGVQARVFLCLSQSTKGGLVRLCSVRVRKPGPWCQDLKSAEGNSNVDPTANQVHVKGDQCQHGNAPSASMQCWGEFPSCPFLKPCFRKPWLPLPGCLIMVNVSHCPVSSRARSSTPDTPATSDTTNSVALSRSHCFYNNTTECIIAGENQI